MIKTEILQDSRTHTWSDRQLKIQQETGAVYDDAIDIAPHVYTEADIPIETAEITAEEFLNTMLGGDSE